MSIVTFLETIEKRIGTISRSTATSGSSESGGSRTVET